MVAHAVVSMSQFGDCFEAQMMEVMEVMEVMERFHNVSDLVQQKS